MQKNKLVFPLAFLLAAILLLPKPSLASLQGTHADNVKIEFHAKQGGEWFNAITKRADDDGVLEFKNVLPGWYELKLEDDDDEKSGQKFAARVRMNDNGGRKIKEKTTVSLYYKNSSGDKVLLGTIETDEDGWIESSAIYPNIKYYFEIDEDDDSHLKGKDGRARVKVKAKIDGSDWFRARYTRTDDSNTVRLKNVLPGKYKFSYKSKDRAATEPFNLRIKMLDDDAAKIKDKEKVKVYVYKNKLKVLVAELETDEDGWLDLPNTMTKTKYKLSL